jgi:hypothetical protein
VADVPGDQTKPAPARRRIGRRLLWALVSPDSYGLVLTLLVIAFCAMAMWTSSYSTSVVLLIEIGTVWFALRTSKAGRPIRRIALVCMVLAALAAVANIVVGADGYAAIFAVAGLLYLIAPFAILRHLGERPGVDQETMLGAICVYLLFGMAFTFIYKDLGAIQPSDFFGSQGDGTLSQVLFFSFTTLTTTGYGNLVPAGNPGQSLAVLEMIIGQLFLITAVGKIVTEWRPRRWAERDSAAGGG